MIKKDKNKGKVKIDPLKINTETIQDLTDADAQKVRGGFGILGPTDAECSNDCRPVSLNPVNPNCDYGPGPKDPPPQSGWCGSDKGCDK